MYMAIIMLNIIDRLFKKIRGLCESNHRAEESSTPTTGYKNCQFVNKTSCKFIGFFNNFTVYPSNLGFSVLFNEGIHNILPCLWEE